MTSSFVKILARHSGPWRLKVSLKPDAKGKSWGDWIEEKTNDPVEAAFAIIDAGGGSILSVQAWSESEKQFVLTIKPSDRKVWESERDGWKDQVKALAAATRETLPKREVKEPAEINDATRAKVLRLRLEGLTYMEIETEMLGETRKGFWAWKIVKAAEKKGKA